MIPIFIKVHTRDGLMRVNVNKIERYWKLSSDCFRNDSDYNTCVDCESVTLDVRETPAQIDNLIEKATLSRFIEIDEVV